jgi:hypothetical protein
MRNLLVATMFALAACGGSHSSGHPDSNGNGDGNGNGDSLGGNPTSVSVTLTNRPNTAATYTFLVAYQDGASAWQLAPAPSGDTYTFTINSPAWGFVWTCIVPRTNLARVELAYFATTEKTSFTENIPVGCSDRYPGPAGLSGAVNNLQTTNENFASFAGATNPVNQAANADTFAFPETPPATHDLLISHATVTNTTAAVVDQVVVMRGVTAPMTGVTIDWNSSVATATANVTATTGAIATTTLYTAGGTTLRMSAQTTAPYASYGLDSTQAMTGDVYDQQVVDRGAGASAIVDTWVSAIADQTYTAPPALGGATSSVPTTMPYPEIMTTWNAALNAIGYAWDARQGGGAVGTVPTVRWTVLLGPTYIGSSPRFQMPDLSMLTGWSAGLAFSTTGGMVMGNVAAYGSSGGAADFPAAVPGRGSNGAPGTTRTTVTSDWTVAP